MSSGETQRQFRWSLIHTPVMITATVIGLRWGALGVAVGYTVSMALLSYPAVLYCVGKSPITLGDFVGSMYRPAIASVLLYLTMLTLPEIAALALALMIRGLIYGVFYIGIWLLLPGGYREARGMLQMVLKAKSTPK